MVIAAVFFCVYLVFVLYLALQGTKKVKNVETFAMGSKDQGPFITAIVWAASMSSAGTFIGVTGQMYANGLSVLWYQLALGIGIPMGFAFFGKGYRRISQKKSSLSVPDWIGDRYGSQFLRVFLGITATLQVTYIAAQFIGAGIVLQSIFGVPYIVGALMAVVIVVGYVFAGGTYAHIYTNILQGVMMIAAALIVFALGFHYFPDILNSLPAGLQAVQQRLVEPFNPNDVAFNSPFAIFGIFFAHLLWGLNPHQVNKVQYLKSNRDLRTFFIWAGVFGVLLSLVTWAGLYTRVLVPNLEKPDEAITTFVSMAFNPVVSGIFLTVFIAAAMSTVDGLLVYMSTVYGNTLYKQGWVKWQESRGVQYDPEKIEKTSLNICRYSLIFVCAIAIPLIVIQPRFMNVLQWVGNGGVLSSFVGPVLFGIYSRRSSRKAAVLSSLIGFFGYQIIYFSGLVPSVYAATACGMILGIVTMGLATAYTEPMPAAESAAWFEKGE